MLVKLIFSLAFIGIVLCYDTSNGARKARENGYSYKSGGLKNGFESSAASTSNNPRYVNPDGLSRSGGGQNLQASSSDADASILKYTQQIDADGSYQYEYETSNGIHAQEQGTPKDVGNDEPIIAVNGQFSYISPEGQQITLTYVADENGFQPQGDHLPTPPPVPEYVQRLLQMIEQNEVKRK